MSAATIIKPGRPGSGSRTRWLDQFRFNKRPVIVTAQPNPGEPEQDSNFFKKIWDLKPISIYSLCSQEKSHVFLMWDKKSFGLNTST